MRSNFFNLRFTLFDYLLSVWQSRYFWWHLAKSDLRSRFRRSFFGVFWAVLQPFGLMILISIVFARMFNQDITEYAPYILSGILIWEYVTAVSVGGALAFVQADSYIKQTRQPLAIYTLRSALSNLFVLMIASTSLLGWAIFALPHNFGVHWLAVPLIVPILISICWPLATIFAYIGVRFRDLPNVLVLVLQAAWFVSPVYFKDSMFREGGLSILVDFNPIYHMMEIVRAPLLEGNWPTMANFVWCFWSFVVLSLTAVFVGRRMEKRVIFYL